MNFKKLSLLMLLFFVADIAFAFDATIVGKSIFKDGTAGHLVQILKPGFPYSGTTPDEVQWSLIGSVKPKTDGKYSIAAKTNGDTLVLSFYHYQNYAVFKVLTILESATITGVDFDLPSFKKDIISAKIRIYEGQPGQESEINYQQRQYKIMLLSSDVNTDTRFVNISNQDYFSTNNLIYDMPAGNYKLLCALNVKGKYDFKYVVTDITLPFAGPGKEYHINFK